MIIDKPIIDSLLIWAHTWTSGRPVKLEILADEFGRILCNVYYREVYGLVDLHPIATTQIGGSK